MKRIIISILLLFTFLSLNAGMYASDKKDVQRIKKLLGKSKPLNDYSSIDSTAAVGGANKEGIENKEPQKDNPLKSGLYDSNPHSINKVIDSFIEK